MITYLPIRVALPVPLRRQLERAAGAGGGFEEQRADAGAGEHRAFVVDTTDRGIADLAGTVQQLQQGAARQAFQGQQVAEAAVGGELGRHWVACSEGGRERARTAWRLRARRASVRR